MPQGEILRQQPCPGPKSLPNKRKDGEHDREQGLSNLPRRQHKFNGVNNNRFYDGDMGQRKISAHER
jgi:hypothetical protein